MHKGIIITVCFILISIKTDVKVKYWNARKTKTRKETVGGNKTLKVTKV